MSYPLLQQIMESINDKGLMKALFITGIPAAGKSHTLSQITDGAIAPRVVNTDKVIEFFHRKGLIDMRNKAEQRTVLDQAKQTTAEQLYHYINGLLPIVVDSTSANEQNVLRRKGLLQSFGYDVAMVWVNVDLETALQRAAGRDRAVDADFIKRAHELAAENKEYFKANFPIFIEIDNSSGVIDNQAVAAAVKKATQFFSAPLANPTGRRIIDTLKQSGQKNITPTVYSEQELRSQTDMWYRA